MKKKLFVFLTALMLVFALCACSSEEMQSGETPTPEASSKLPDISDLIFPVIEEDYWDIFDYNCNMVYDYAFISMNGLRFTLLSASPLENGDITVASDTGLDMIAEISPFNGEEESCTMYEDVFLLYQGVTPEELRAYSYRGLSGERQGEIYNLIQKFRSLDESQIPTIYRYTLSLIAIDTTADGEVITANEMTVTINGESKTYKLGTISSRSEESREFVIDPDYNLNCFDCLGSFGQAVDVSEDGRSVLNNLQYNAVNDVTLTGMRFYKNDAIEIRKVSVTQTTDDGATIDTEWNITKPFKLSAGETIVLNVEIADPFFAGTLGGWDAIYLLIEYQYNGKTYELGMPFYCVQTLDDPFAYIAMEDGIDILSYYTDYLNRNRAY